MNIGVLTEDLLLEVLKRLPPEDAAATACVCRNWCAALHSMLCAQSTACSCLLIACMLALPSCLSRLGLCNFWLMECAHESAWNVLQARPF